MSLPNQFQQQFHCFRRNRFGKFQDVNHAVLFRKAVTDHPLLFTRQADRAAVVAAIRELDPDNALHLNTLLTLFEEGSWLAILPILMVFPVLALLLMVVFAFCGWLFSVPLRKLAEKRRAYWDAAGKDGMLKAVRTRAIAVFALGTFLSAIPVLGYLVTVVALNLFVFGVIALYEKSICRISARILMRFMKLTMFLVAIAFSSIAFMGALLLLPYLVSYVIRAQKVRNG